jgi:formylglycine-generating enzyme required for sulfatase activity
MVVIPPGTFQMGSPESEPGRDKDEGREHEVRITYAFAVSAYPITRGEWRQYLTATGRSGSSNCKGYNQSKRDFETRQEYSWSKPGFAQDDNHPVVCVAWLEALDYAKWLSDRTGHQYRLLSEAEYEYVNRAGSQSAYPWGYTSDGQCAHVNGEDATLKAGHGNAEWGHYAECTDGFEFTSPVDHFPANAFGLHDTSGNVLSWTQDCYHDSYERAPSDGSAWESAGNCLRVTRGGGWYGSTSQLRSAYRYSEDVHGQSEGDVGLRLARTLP